MKKIVEEKANLMKMFPRDPIVRGSFFKFNKKYAKSRKKKKREFKQNILNKLDTLESDNPKEYWSLVNLLKTDQKDKPENTIDGETWFKHFSKLATIQDNMKERVSKIEEKVKLLEKNVGSFSVLDFEISLSEVEKAITKLKNNKSPGLDNISNEMLKVSQIYMNPCLLKLFNAVFRSGHYPNIWSESFICPLFKSGDKKNPENYRGIAINSSIGKVFNIILCNRLDKLLLDNKIIHENQIGFSKKARTSDHIFVLKCLIDKYLNYGNKKVFACFVDFRKAFDKVIHTGIMLKLLNCNIDSYFCRIL